PTDMSLLMQREVAERIVVRDGKQSLLSLSVTVFGEPKYIAKVDRKYFSPSPKVHSAIIAIHNISQGKLSRQQQQLFFDILHAGFAHKRKQLLKNLQSLDSKEIWQNIFEQLGISLTIRAEEIDVLKWITIVQYYEKILQEK
ncbi:MAG: rRNA adenine N-6-methyltransferase family protein, partial [Minisyncoccia bacterium]